MDTASISEPLDLTDPHLWTQLSAEEDPFGDHRPVEVSCDEEDGLTVESGLLEIDTTFCNYASLVQPSLTTVDLGEVLEVLVYHGSLTSSEEAEAHVALMLGEQVVWEQQIGIPSGSGVYSVEVDAALSAPAGTSVVFHLHNHGANSWNLGHFRRAD